MKKAVMLLLFLSLFASLVSAQRFFDYGYGPGGGFFGRDYGIGFGFFDSLCLNYGEFFEFFILFIIFFVLVHWAFGRKGAFGERSKTNILGVAIALALSFGIVRWESRTGLSLVCGLGDVFSGLFGLIFLLLIIFIFFAVARGGSGAKSAAGVAYILFYFWLGSEGGYGFSSFFYYLPLDPFFVQAVLNILLVVAFIFTLYFGYKWFRGE